MRIAVLYYGRVMHYEKKFVLNSLPESCECDFFYSADAEPKKSVNDFIKLYNPKGIINDKITYNADFESYALDTNYYYVNLKNMTCHFINNKRAFELLEAHGGTYDLIIGTRLDLQIGKLDLKIPEPNTIYIPEGNDWLGVNDQFAMGDFETMRKYMIIYDNTHFLLENKLSPVHPESLTLANLNHWKINIVRFPLEHRIIR